MMSGPAPASASPGGPAADGSHEGRPLRVLVVDDDRILVETTCRLLRALGKEVCVAYDGPGAVEAARRFQPDAALLDVTIPGLDGYEVARRLRQEQGERLLLVAITGHPIEEDRRRSLEAGFSFYLLKPYDSHALEVILALANPPAR